MAVLARVSIEGCGALVPGRGDDRDVVAVVVVEAVERPKLGAAGRSPRGEEVEQEGFAGGEFLQGGGLSVRQGERNVGRAVAGGGAGRDVGAPCRGGRRGRRVGSARRRGGRREGGCGRGWVGFGAPQAASISAAAVRAAADRLRAARGLFPSPIATATFAHCASAPPAPTLSLWPNTPLSPPSEAPPGPCRKVSHCCRKVSHSLSQKVAFTVAKSRIAVAKRRSTVGLETLNLRVNLLG